MLGFCAQRRASKDGSTRAATVGSSSTDRCTSVMTYSERKSVEYVCGVFSQILGLSAFQFLRIPQLKMGGHTQQHGVALQPHCSAQFGSDQYPTSGVQINVLSTTQQQALQETGTHGEAGNLFALFFPHTARIHQQTAVGMASEGQAALFLLQKRVTVPSRNGHPTLSIQCECAAALEHFFPPLFYTISDFSPLYGGKPLRSRQWLQFFQSQQALSALS